uniref:Uncharacterized protein n=1 Tax=Salix viminalis TaxID=40686 RepID=A0A6N2L7M3_SALVM
MYNRIHVIHLIGFSHLMKLPCRWIMDVQGLV